MLLTRGLPGPAPEDQSQASASPDPASNLLSAHALALTALDMGGSEQHVPEARPGPGALQVAQSGTQASHVPPAAAVVAAPRGGIGDGMGKVEAGVPNGRMLGPSPAVGIFSAPRGMTTVAASMPPNVLQAATHSSAASAFAMGSSGDGAMGSGLLHCSSLALKQQASSPPASPSRDSKPAHIPTAPSTCQPKQEPGKQHKLMKAEAAEQSPDHGRASATRPSELVSVTSLDVDAASALLFLTEVLEAEVAQRAAGSSHMEVDEHDASGRGGSAGGSATGLRWSRTGMPRTGVMLLAFLPSFPSWNLLVCSVYA